MKVAPVFGLIVVVVILGVAQGRPLESDKSTRDASVYVLGSLYNAAVSHNYSKSQAASDRNESEWNNTEMLNGVNKNPGLEDEEEDEEELAKRKGKGKGKSNPPKKEGRKSGGVLIYSGGDAANLAVSYQGSESQAAENDQKSGYNSQNLGMGPHDEELEEFEEEDERK